MLIYIISIINILGLHILCVWLAVCVCVGV